MILLFFTNMTVELEFEEKAVGDKGKKDKGKKEAKKPKKGKRKVDQKDKPSNK